MLYPTSFPIYFWILVPIIIFGRYVVFSAIPYFVFYVWKRGAWLYRKIQPRFPTPTDYQREIGYSALSSLIFSAMVWLCLGTPLRAFTQYYTEIEQYGLGWLLVSIPITLLIHDTYFYWMHRLMHWPKLYRLMHRTHHRSVNPSPWAAFAFHPLEAVVEAGIIPILLIVMPLHPISFLGFVTVMLVFNIYGHLGYELFSAKTYQHPIGKWLNTSVYHNLHHEKFTGNYGLYFTFWDRVCGTLRADSLQKVEQIHAREKSGAREGGVPQQGQTLQQRF